ncbi:MAG TPA: mechanosensitive ion channel domain-containing protein [Ignavibacteriaceae bacterium]|nr:mechanosensitive ion channel domain-containing protein [Ignavibacteriaceae bacterium]
MDEFLKPVIEIFDQVKKFLSFHLFEIGNSSITLWTLLYFIFLAWLLFYLTAKLRKWIVYKILSDSKIDLGVRLAVGTIIRYGVLVFGLVIVMQTVGINLSTLTVLAGALGVGIGFGLQNITNNFVSGIIILFERPIKVGDRIQVGDVNGDVISISMRSTTVVTNDNISVIVPNSEFISSRVINWSHNDRNVRFNIPVGVAYKEDPEKVKQILLEVADKDEGVLKNPKPDVLFVEFGDSSLNFNLRIWTNSYITTPAILQSKLYFEIFKKFKEAGIEIPFPQRDMHIKNTEFQVSQPKTGKN